MCGATRQLKYANYYGPGLSPRVRGNRRGDLAYLRTWGPIPACAGQPFSYRHADASKRAYPRVCGATAVITKAEGLVWGLSPRVRGNLSKLPNGYAGAGPIPACAGQPQSASKAICAQWAYPRVCGATLSFLPNTFLGYGLSPRVRGNRLSAQNLPFSTGPIPACAGQPRATRPIT